MQNSSDGTGRVIRFDVFEVDLAARQLRKRERRVKVQDLPFRLLVALLEQPGEVVAREELRTRLWGDTAVEVDDGLHTAVRKLREVLGDSATRPRFIGTVPRRAIVFWRRFRWGRWSERKRRTVRESLFRKPHLRQPRRRFQSSQSGSIRPRGAFGWFALVFSCWHVSG